MTPCDTQLDRRFRALRPHIAPRNAALDALCAVAVDATGCTQAVVTLCDGERHTVIGACNFDQPEFPCLFPQDMTEAFFEGSNLDRDPAMAGHDLVSGRLGSVRSYLATPIRSGDQLVGVFALGSRQRQDAFSPLDRALLFRLARVADGMIRAEVSLSRVVAQAMDAIGAQLR